MKIGIDARHARLGLGVGTFVRELGAALSELPDVELVWFGSPDLAPAAATTTCNVSRTTYPLLDSPIGRRLVARSGVDLFHFTGNTGWRRTSPIPTVLTVHDLIFMRSEARARTLRQLVGHEYERLTIRAAVRCASRVVVPSQTTHDDVMATLHPARPPAVVPQGVRPPDGSAVPDLPAGGNGAYIVAFSGRDPRKNVSVVLEALRSRECPDLRLRLLAGAGLPIGFAQEAAAPELQTGRIEVLGYLSRAEMWSVLAGAEALVYPSSDEGFGLPVIEAMAAGVPVVSGLASVTLEVGGDAILRIDDRSPAESIARALKRIVSDPGARQRTVDEGRAQAAKFTWRKTAERYRAVYAEALGW